MSEFKSMTNIDGAITPTAEARVPVLDRGFLYGDSVYEVFRTYDAVPLFYEEHWARLLNSAALIRMQVRLTLEQLTAELRKTIAATGAPALRRDVYVRYIVTRGEGPVDLYPDPALAPRYVLIVREVPKWNPVFYSRGVTAAIAATRRNPGSALDPNIKGGNYLNNVLGVLDARAHGADDCVMLNDAGLVTEASNSNVFFVLRGELVTPAQTAANLRGLTKGAVHAACAARGLPSRERDVQVDELRYATECFVTSATREVMPVVSLRMLDGSVLGFPAGGGPVTRRVAEHYRDYVAEYVRRHAQLALF
jgi:branched-chain amino acid aminotransferase